MEPGRMPEFGVSGVAVEGNECPRRLKRGQCPPSKTDCTASQRPLPPSVLHLFYVLPHSAAKCVVASQSTETADFKSDALLALACPVAQANLYATEAALVEVADQTFTSDTIHDHNNVSAAFPHRLASRLAQFDGGRSFAQSRHQVIDVDVEHVVREQVDSLRGDRVDQA